MLGDRTTSSMDAVGGISMIDAVRDKRDRG